MLEEFDVQKLKSEYPQFFEEVPPELLEFILAKETSSKIAEICFESGVEDEEKIEKIAYRITLALLGKIPKENLTEILEKGVGLNHETARKIHALVNLLISSKIKETQPLQPTKPKRSPLIPELVLEEELEKPPKSENPLKKDIYREPKE